MRRLTVNDVKQKETLAQKLDGAREKLEAVAAEYNTAIRELWGPVEDAVTAYNDAREEVNDFCGGICDDIENYTSERAESWQESNAATSYDEWKSMWDEEIDELQIDEPDDIEVPEEAYDGSFLRDKEDQPNL